MPSLTSFCLNWRRYYLPISLLTLILQRAPVLRAFVSAETSGKGPASAILRGAFIGIAGKPIPSHRRQFSRIHPRHGTRWEIETKS